LDAPRPRSLHWLVRLDDLSGLLLRHRPEIVHFSGQGDTLGAIALDWSGAKTSGRNLLAPSSPGATATGPVATDGSYTPVAAGALTELFRILRDNVRVVLLNACYSEAQAKGIVKHIDCAIGMSTRIGDEAAIAFAAEFYQALAYGKSLQEAFDLGEVRLMGEGQARSEQNEDLPAQYRALALIWFGPLRMRELLGHNARRYTEQTWARDRATEGGDPSPDQGQEWRPTACRDWPEGDKRIHALVCPFTGLTSDAVCPISADPASG
jgi:hypothetical protein